MSNLSEEISLLQKLLNELGKEEKLLVTDITRMERKMVFGNGILKMVS